MRLAPLVMLLTAATIVTAVIALCLAPDGDTLQLMPLISGKLSAIDRQLLLELRLPRQLLAFCAGALLAASGAAIQARFQNPLSEPGLVGISGGAALAAAFALQWMLPSPLVSVLAFSGGIGGLLLTWLMSRRAANGERLILAGIAVNAIFGSLLTLRIVTLPDGSLRTITFWLMGSFANADWAQARLFLLLTPPLLALLYREWRLLNALQLGLQSAFHLGFDARGGGLRIVLLAALAASLVVSNCGMVAFIGLMAPHLARQLVGSHARRVLIAAPLLGGWLALLADTAAHALLYPAELPVGVITSLAGAPFFLWLLWKNGKEGGWHA
jgi:iron complex transport system permease protein